MPKHTIASHPHQPSGLQRNSALQRLIQCLLLTILLTTNAYAQVGGLQKTTTFLQMIESEIHIIVPIIAIIGGLVLVALYMNDMIRKDTLIQWFIGLVIATMIVEVVAFVF
ncbi:TrbC/VirB2 family protein [Castellaniella sp.]|uniref:TrbC/VirB2 family protein n=1 Tax=Castellaniella sp. TaxID=1955812 RepID=UPI002AFEF5E8|nr:TrbC/VirB2 family protein [Castellaniella sp.]